MILADVRPAGPLLEAWRSFENGLSELLVPPLRALEAPIDDFFNGLPIWAGQACVTALFALACLWAVTRTRQFIYIGAPDQAPWRDLRIWAVLMSLPYVCIYWYLG